MELVPTVSRVSPTPQAGDATGRGEREVLVSGGVKPLDNDELRRRVDEVLYYVWDPIGVSDEPCARGEYDNYIPKVFDLLLNNEGTEPIAVYLADVVRTRMAMPLRMEHCEKVADLLLRHKHAIEDGLR